MVYSHCHCSSAFWLSLSFDRFVPDSLVAICLRKRCPLAFPLVLFLYFMLIVCVPFPFGVLSRLYRFLTIALSSTGLWSRFENDDDDGWTTGVYLHYKPAYVQGVGPCELNIIIIHNPKPLCNTHRFHSSPPPFRKKTMNASLLNSPRKMAMIFDPFSTCTIFQTSKHFHLESTNLWMQLRQ